MTHYIAMGGEHGCMPDNCQAYETIEDAIEGLDNIYELETWQRIELSRLETLRDATGTSVKLNRDQGGAYCEISKCDCGEPWEHAEFDSADNWPDYIEEEDEEDTEPSEGDYIISDSRGETVITKCEDYHYRKVIKEYSEAYDIIKNEMEREKYWPNVWTLSDHGNYNLISLDSLKEE